MPEEKRPKPTIDMTAGRIIEPAPPRLEAPKGMGGGATSSAPLRQPQRGGRILGYLLSGIIGGIIAMAGAYLALKQDIPGVSLTDPVAENRIAMLQERTASLENALRANPKGTSASGFTPGNIASGDLNEVNARLDSVVNAARSLNQSVDSLTYRIQAVEQGGQGSGAKGAIQGEVASQLAPISEKLASLEREVETLARVQSERQADARTAALTLALTNLKRAISDGRPFAGELAAIDNLSSAKLPVSQLSPYKDDGVASLAELQREFASASQKTIEKHYGKKTDSIMGEVLSRAKAAIRVTPADGSGTTVEAALGRMGAALRAGDLKSALTQGATLDDPPEEMKAWLGKAQARMAADEALRKTDQELLASLTKVPGRRQ
ncbi:MAG: hypothetical protein WBX25_13100 [Rhodomicrobium sp.]